MRTIPAFLAGLLLVAGVSAQDSSGVTAGSQAPSFILKNGNTLQSVTMPYMKKIVLLNFWSSTDVLSGLYNDWLKKIAVKYRNASFKNADGFEILSFAVQSDKNAWQESINRDSLQVFTNFLAAKGLAEEVCLKYGVNKIPYRVLIDETGMILSTDPSMMMIETMLDERRDFQPLRKSISGLLAHSSSKADVLKYSKVYLFSVYGDSIARSLTSEKGSFVFEDVNLAHDYMLKVDNKSDINTSDPIALYTGEGHFLTDGRTRDEGFVFPLSSRVCNRLVQAPDSSLTVEGLEQIDVIKSLAFSSDGSALTPRDQREVQPIVARLKGNPSLFLEITTHTDARLEPAAALDLTSKQANALKDYFQSRGISPTRIKAVARGNSDLRKRCDGTIDCRDEDHLLNRRVEFLVYKD